MAFLDVKELTVSFAVPHGLLPVVRGIDLAVEQGEIFGIVGESGSGKSMTSLAMMGLTPPGAIVTAHAMNLGELDLLTAPAHKIRGRRISMIFQDPAAALNPVFTISQQMDLVLHRHQPDLSRSARRQRAIAMLNDVGLRDPETVLMHYPHQLSGGMQQRVLIAMALLAGPDLLIADEPTTALDVTVQMQILRLLQELRDRLNLTVLLITHDLGVVAAVCERVAVMHRGHVVETGPVAGVLKTPAMPYTRALLAAVPRRGSRGQMLPSVANTGIAS